MAKLSLSNITKSFGDQSVLKGVDFGVSSGEVHALLGANGAGKSTLMKILSGDYERDSGTITIDEKEQFFKTPADAKLAGIEMVVQEVDTALVSSLSIAENVTMNSFISGTSFFSWNKRNKKAKELLRRVGLHIDPTFPLSHCSLAQKQLVLIAKALSSDISFIILDEPTAALSKKEADHLFTVLRELQKDGVGIIYISHRLPEVLTLSTKITVLKDGYVTLHEDTDSSSTKRIVQAMLGNDLVELLNDEEKRVLGKTLFEVKEFTVPATNEKISLSVKQGEIVGIAGLVGAGKTETARAFFGADPSPDPIIMNGNKVKITSPQKAIASGIGFVPEERRKEGVLVDYNVIENLTLPVLNQFTKFGLIQKEQEKKEAERWIKQLGIKTESPSLLLNHLSGGNQQKAAIGKWLLNDGDVFILDEPTKGIDVGAKQDVFQCMKDLADKSKGILYFTSEFQELLAFCDRILVMYDGKIAGELTKEEATMEKIMHFATGGHYGTVRS
ncbi:sugar ABC transporter ATP-binding protein [Fictibacillus phosphorivorans]|uniref:sugar ABC transporter ATP-binding protein n=1 Tax=Fictibacillus phosphorivorans TaxID=1221500 RepID=UPI0020426587|nr:sugar ABC transporter ATP-binding protein [Fictibacillus phosphorivorans]MCM3718678.1 sugar ABC transporter ATP-binding protein [Fictibacillus phosphorivorans]MCM3776301.1 sugar ABC transporter ATP-binding protein [Fictibacillus phosphorivorans]